MVLRRFKMLMVLVVMIIGSLTFAYGISGYQPDVISTATVDTSVAGNWSYDFETNQQATSGTGIDFLWDTTAETEYFISFSNGATATIYAGAASYEEIDAKEASGQTYSTNKIDGSPDTNTIPDGTILLLKTGEGNYVKMIITSHGIPLYFSFDIIYEGTQTYVDGTWSYDFEGNLQGGASYPSDFFWAQVSETERYVGMLNEATAVIYSGSLLYNDIDLTEASSLTLSSSSIDASVGSTTFTDWTILVFKTGDGNFVKMMVTQYGYTLNFVFSVLSELPPPDLEITHIEIESTFFPHSTSSADWVGVTYTIKNSGGQPVDPSSFRTQVFNITKDGVDQVESFYGWMNPGSQITSLPAGGSGNYTFSISFGNTWPVGVYRFAIMADYQNAVVEGNEDNNISPFIEFEIYNATLYNKPDLVITHLEIEDDFFPYSTTSADWVPVTYTLENQGPVAVDPSSFRTQVFNITKDGVDQSESFYGWMNPGSQIASLPAGGKGNYTFSISFGNTW
ncbi:MAG: CARDB domain-containing protein, partial [Candidatus Kariarchaeaceae archaeon]